MPKYGRDEGYDPFRSTSEGPYQFADEAWLAEEAEAFGHHEEGDVQAQKNTEANDATDS